jgi:Ca2+-dependent lipid-binding protein
MAYNKGASSEASVEIEKEPAFAVFFPNEMAQEIDDIFAKAKKSKKSTAVESGNVAEASVPAPANAKTATKKTGKRPAESDAILSVPLKKSATTAAQPLVHEDDGFGDSRGNRKSIFYIEPS